MTASPQAPQATGATKGVRAGGASSTRRTVRICSSGAARISALHSCCIPENPARSSSVAWPVWIRAISGQRSARDRPNSGLAATRTPSVSPVRQKV